MVDPTRWRGPKLNGGLPFDNVHPRCHINERPSLPEWSRRQTTA